MKEIFSQKPVSSKEKEITAEALKRQIEKGLVDLEDARQQWISNIETLKEKIPHDDIMLDQKTYSYHVTLNAWSGELMKLEEEEKELHQMLKGIESIDA